MKNEEINKAKLLRLSERIKGLKEDLFLTEKKMQSLADLMAREHFDNVLIGDRWTHTEEVNALIGPTWNKTWQKKTISTTSEVVGILALLHSDSSATLRVLTKKVNKDGSLSKAENASSLTERPDAWRSVLVKF